MDGPFPGNPIACDFSLPKTVPEDEWETYELVNRAFQHLPPPEMHRLLANRLDSRQLAEFLADPHDNSLVKKLARQQVRQDPSFAEDLARAIATVAATTPAAVTRRLEPVQDHRKSNLAAVLMSGRAAILLALLAVVVFKPRPAKRRNRVSS